ncbi:sigma-70 factor domain-containing protein [Clostridium sp. D5]|uniref:sigma-70 factor domain-containing protein n=1 Tax=Clostridium sp. D5 TaxID=556261 RepID=UPI001FA78943|nr:sigma-70 factor domain-containing protein [Clostridium sp. D5]
MDTVKHYLKQAGKAKLLNKKDEYALAVRAKQGDDEAKNKLHGHLFPQQGCPHCHQ